MPFDKDSPEIFALRKLYEERLPAFVMSAEIVVAGRRAAVLCNPCSVRSGGLAPPMRAIWLKIADKRVQLRIVVVGKPLTAPLQLE